MVFDYIFHYIELLVNICFTDLLKNNNLITIINERSLKVIKQK
jgi:hypothetical protein